MKGWWKPWWLVTVAAALVATAIDAVLLELRRSFFTGGFLAVDHITGPLQAAAFLTTSFLIDCSFAGLLAAAAFWVCRRAGASRLATTALAGAAALAPLGIANVIEYRLLSYFGEGFDLGLMFDLTGRSPGEIVAVASPQLALAGAVAAATVVAGIVAVRAAMRRAGTRGGTLPAVAGRSVLLLACALIALGAVTTTLARTESDVLDNGIRRKPSGRFMSMLVNAASDFDRDGFGLLGRPPDPDLFNARIQPYAVDIPGDGIDQDGVGGDLPAGTRPYADARLDNARWTSTPDVVLIVLESFRADAVGAHVNGRAVTPVLDALAARGILAHDAYSHNGYTVQSRRHIFTGSESGDGGGTTLVDDFKAQGYQTAYFSAQDESFGGPEQGVGFERADVSYDARADRGQRYSTFATAGSLAVPHTVLNARIASFLRAKNDRPLFLYVNFHDTHFPYHHRDIVPIVSSTVVPQGDIGHGRTTELREMYLNTAANVDRAIGTLLANVRAALGRDPGVIVLSDHGESLFEEGFLGHGYALDDAQTRIPLIVSGLPLEVTEPFGQSDLRGLLRDAFTGDAPMTAPPVVRRDPSKRVFQYLGNVDTAAEIGFVTDRGRIQYDLRSRQARIRGGAWTHEDALPGSERAAVLDLIHLWERMLLAVGHRT